MSNDWRANIEPYKAECPDCGKEHSYHVGRVTCRNCGRVFNP